jgi:hypothetical protein
MVVALSVLADSLWLVRRGSAQALLIWLAALTAIEPVQLAGRFNDRSLVRGVGVFLGRSAASVAVCGSAVPPAMWQRRSY